MTVADRRKVLTAIALSAAVPLVVLLVAVVVVLVIALISPSLVLSDPFFWGSAAAVVGLHLTGGVLAGRLTGPRLRRAGLTEARPRYVAAVSGPVMVALLTNLHPVEEVPPILGTVVPVAAAAVGVLLGLRRSRSRRRTGVRPGSSRHLKLPL